MKRTTVLIMLLSCLLLAVSAPVFAVTPNSTFEPDKPRKGMDQPTGLFGGIRPDGTFVFKLSESKGIRFYKVSDSAKLSGFSSQITVSTIPLGTPIRLTIDNYRIVGIEALGGTP